MNVIAVMCARACFEGEMPIGAVYATFIENGNMIMVLFHATYGVEVDRHQLKIFSTGKVSLFFVPASMKIRAVHETI